MATVPYIAPYPKEYRELKTNTALLSRLAEETGGRILLAGTTEEMVEQGEEVAREIDTQYVVTYQPKRPLRTASATAALSGLSP